MVVFSISNSRKFTTGDNLEGLYNLLYQRYKSDNIVFFDKLR